MTHDLLSFNGFNCLIKSTNHRKVKMKKLKNGLILILLSFLVVEETVAKEVSFPVAGYSAPFYIDGEGSYLFDQYDSTVYFEESSIVEVKGFSRVTLTRDLKIQKKGVFDIHMEKGAYIYFWYNPYASPKVILAATFNHLLNSTAVIAGKKISIKSLDLRGPEDFKVTFNGVEEFPSSIGVVQCKEEANTAGYLDKVYACPLGTPKEITLKNNHPILIDAFTDIGSEGLKFHLFKGEMISFPTGSGCQSKLLKDVPGTYQLDKDHQFVSIDFDEPQASSFVGANGVIQNTVEKSFNFNGADCSFEKVRMLKQIDLTALLNPYLYSAGHGFGHCHFPSEIDGPQTVCQKLGFERKYANQRSIISKTIALKEGLSFENLNPSKQFCLHSNLEALPRVGVTTVLKPTTYSLIDEVECGVLVKKLD